MLAVDQRKKSGVGATVTGSPARQRHELLLLEKRLELDQLRLRRLDQARRLPDGAAWPSPTRSSGSPPFSLRGRVAKRLAGVDQLAFGNRQQPVDGQAASPSSRRSFCSNLSRPSRKVARPLDACSVLQVLDVAANRVGRLGGGIGEIAEQVQVVDVTQRARQVALDEAQRALERVDADLDEDAGRILDVVARRLQQPRRLPQLGQDPARPFGRRRVGEDGLRGQARREDVRVEMRVALPGAHFLELEQPRPHVVGQQRQFGRFDGA